MNQTLIVLMTQKKKKNPGKMYLSKEREAMQALKLLKQGGKCICLFSIPAEVIISGKESLGAVTLLQQGHPVGRELGLLKSHQQTFTPRS